MNVFAILDMAAGSFGDRQAIGAAAHGPTYAELSALAASGATTVPPEGCVVFVGQSGQAFATTFFACARAGTPFVPLNYRLADDQLAALVRRVEPGLIVCEPRYADAVAPTGAPVMTTDDWLARCSEHKPSSGEPDEPERPALLLFTSGTSAEPKAAVLEHRNLAAYILGSVEFAGAAEEEAALVSVPPYHIAGVANLLSNVFAGRRIVYLSSFDPAGWLNTVRSEGITHAMVVPTMLAQVVESLGDATHAAAPTLRTISYGGARMPVPVLERALALFPGVDFVNAYGLTETSSSIAVLSPEDHRMALGSTDPAVRGRLGSVGQILPGVEVEVRDETGRSVPGGQHGEIWVRGEQVSGRYAGSASPCDQDGWFPTRDAGWLDADGYLYVEGRADDTIIRGGENIAPAEIEEVLLRHPAVTDAAVVGVPDQQWGQRVGAAVVLRPGASVEPDELAAWSRQHLRRAKAVEVVVVRTELPRTTTGKLLRRQVLADLVATSSAGSRR